MPARELARPRAVLGLMALFALVWIAHLHGVALTPPMDNVEQWVWSHALQWGYHKHPPLPTWGLWLVRSLGLDGPLVKVVLGAACSLASVALMHRLLREAGSPFAAWLAVLAALSITFYSGRLNYYNHNITLMLCVSATVYAWWRILQGGGYRWWVLLGAAAGLGLLSKYQYVLVLLPSAVCLAWLRPWKQPRVWLQVALALGIAGLLFAPHVLWLLAQPSGATPMAYAMQSARPTGLAALGSIKALQVSALWLADLVFNRGLPMLIVLLVAVLAVRRSRQGGADGRHASWSVPVTHGGAAANPSASGRWAFSTERFLLAWGLLPPLSITLLGLVLGLDLQLQWGTAFALWLTPAVMVVLRLLQAQPPERAWWTVLIVFAVLQSVLLLQSYLSSSAGCCPNPKHWRNFDSGRVARELDAAARAAVGGQFRVLVGSATEAGAVALALPERPRVLISGRLEISPWLSAEDLRRDGVVELFSASGSAPPDAQRLPSGWAWRLHAPPH